MHYITKYTKLCKVVHPWKSVSEIQFIKEVCILANILEHGQGKIKHTGLLHA